MVRPSRARRAALAFAAVTLTWLGSAAAEDINRMSLTGEAIEGYDPVAYFAAGAPREGSRAFRFEWRGAVWRFVSKDDLELFKADPVRYQPALGGWCAYAMSKGIKADIHPFAFAIQDGQLFLFATFESRDKFLANSQIRRAAEEHWSVLAERYF
jgi:hypothetical protein